MDFYAVSVSICFSVCHTHTRTYTHLSLPLSPATPDAPVPPREGASDVKVPGLSCSLGYTGLVRLHKCAHAPKHNCSHTDTHRHTQTHNNVSIKPCRWIEKQAGSGVQGSTFRVRGRVGEQRVNAGTKKRLTNVKQHGVEVSPLQVLRLRGWEVEGWAECVSEEVHVWCCKGTRIVVQNKST